MVLIKEYRIVMPFTQEEYKTGQRYSVARTSNENTSSSSGEGIEILENKPITNIDPHDPEKKEINGTYTKKIYHLKSMIPGWITPFLPNSASKLEEEAWDCFPYCKTVLTFPFLGERFQFIIESRHTSGETGLVENIHGLDKDTLKKRHVEVIDIAKDEVEKKYYKKEEDPKIFHSEKSGKGPLKPTWMKEQKDLMCCYKLVTVRCKITGLQSRIEKYLHSVEKSIFVKFNQQVFCWQEEWWGKTMEEIIEIEKNFFTEMNNKISKTVEEEKKEEESGKTEPQVELPPESSAEESEKDSEEIASPRLGDKTEVKA